MPLNEWPCCASVTKRHVSAHLETKTCFDHSFPSPKVQPIIILINEIFTNANQCEYIVDCWNACIWLKKKTSFLWNSARPHYQWPSFLVHILISFFNVNYVSSTLLLLSLLVISIPVVLVIVSDSFLTEMKAMRHRVGQVSGVHYCLVCITYPQWVFRYVRSVNRRTNANSDIWDHKNCLLCKSKSQLYWYTDIL